MISARKAIFTFGASLFIFIFCGQLQAALIIDPALIKINLKNGRRASGTFRLQNTEDAEKRYRAKATYFTLNPKGGLVTIADDGYSLAEWIKFNPKEFVIPAQSSRVIRYSVIASGKLKPREYRGAIEFTPLDTSSVKSHDSAGHIFNLKVLSVVLVPIYGFVDGTKSSGQIKDIRVERKDEQLTAYCAIANTGDGTLRLKGQCRIIDSSGKMVEELPLKSVVVFPKNERILKTPIKKTLESGGYIARFQLKSTDSAVNVELAHETKFSV